MTSLEYGEKLKYLGTGKKPSDFPLLENKYYDRVQVYISELNLKDAEDALAFVEKDLEMDNIVRSSTSVVGFFVSLYIALGSALGLLLGLILVMIVATAILSSKSGQYIFIKRLLLNRIEELRGSTRDCRD